MKRKALLISNPGEIGADNYCEGVKVDIKNYIKFLTSPLGGAWRDDEIIQLYRPTVTQVKNEVKTLHEIDYSLIAFCGHGWYSSIDKSTILELKKSESIDSLDLRINATKRLIILDCCRKSYPISIMDSVSYAIAMEEKSALALNPKDCRHYYDESIKSANDGISVLYGCNKDEISGENSSEGGYYSSSLILGCENWRKTNSALDLSKKYSIFNIVLSHNAAIPRVRKLSANKQNPQIEKPRSEPYFPFAVIA